MLRHFLVVFEIELADESLIHIIDVFANLSLLQNLNSLVNFDGNDDFSQLVELLQRNIAISTCNLSCYISSSFHKP